MDRKLPPPQASPRPTERGLGTRPSGEGSRSTRRSFSFPSPQVDFGAEALEGESPEATGEGLESGDGAGRAALRKRVFFKPGELPQWLTRASPRDQRKESGTFLVPPRERSELPRTALSSSLARDTVRRSQEEDTGAVSPHTVPHPTRIVTPREEPLPPSTKPRRARPPWLSSRARKVWPWVARVAAVILTGAALGGLASMRVGTQARARGVLSSMGEPQVIVAGVTGAVSDIGVKVGDEVAAGQVIGRVSSPELQANLARRQRELVTLRAELEAEEEARHRDAKEALASLAERRSLLARRLTLKDQEIRSRQLRLENLQRLIDQGIAAPTEALGVAAALSAATEERLGIQAELSQISVEEAEHRRSGHRERFRSLRLSGAEANAREAQQLLELSEVRAPTAGWIEELSVPEGAIVQPGSIIARIVSVHAPREIVAFVPSDDSGFVAPGDPASVSFEGLPRSEFGTLGARVTRVSMEVAAPDQVRTLLGRVPDEPLVRVELQLIADRRYERLVPHLRSGSPVLVRLPSVDRKLFRVVSDRVQAWFS